MHGDELAAAVSTLKQFFFEKLFSFHYKYYDSRIKKPNFEIASGFCTIHKEMPLFVTCAHALVDLGKKLQSGLVQEVSIGVPCRPKSLLGFGIDDEHLASFVYWDGHPRLDFAIGPCDEELRQAMVVGGAKCLQLRPMQSGLNEGKYFLFGFSAADSLAKVNDLFYVPTADGFKMLHSSDMGAFAPKCFPVSVPVLLGDGRLESKLLSSDVETVAGMSGGFVIKLFPGRQIRQFEFVGIQSEQSTLGGKVTSIRYSPSNIILECLDAFVESVGVTQAGGTSEPVQ